ncbi:hypothetical protein [Sinorhizobium psoraleae]|uniref:Uncharacterized protein n=1 Tax=Sinorhizobium psoraleae TaxID=520838 RepID=A0ABT4KAC5_9HYPH|nr:hypothetical protein [Sinorhizobium psoraleae]MCZ4088841.1 hypothetical protein [Sinorhizobium psoraleae]
MPSISRSMIYCQHRSSRQGGHGANAALIAATLFHLCGANAQVGIPAGNRNWLSARMIAGVSRSGLAAGADGQNEQQDFWFCRSRRSVVRAMR